MDNVEENVDEIILAHCWETVLLSKFLRGVRNHCLPSFLSAESQAGN